MLNLKELNEAIQKHRDDTNLALLEEIRHYLPEFENAVKASAVGGKRYGKFTILLKNKWEDIMVPGAEDLISNELTAYYKPIVVECVENTIGVGCRYKPSVTINYTIPGMSGVNDKTQYGYRMSDAEEMERVN